MTYEQIVRKAIQRGIPQEKAENLAMNLHLQGACNNESLVENAIRMTLTKIKNEKADQ